MIPPPKERDPELARIPTLDEIAYLTGKRIGKHWPIRTAFLDAQHVAPALENDGLVRMFEVARSYNPNLVPVATLSDLDNPVFRRLLKPTSPRLGVFISYDDLDTEALVTRVRDIGCSHQDCVIFIDFTGADLEPERAAGAIGFVFDLLDESATWGKIVFQGSAFPSTNPAQDGQSILIPRNEHKSFYAALKDCSVVRDRIGYGDYAADCGEINFPTKGGGKPIPHIRYTTPTDTLVVRGNKEGTYEQVIREVCKTIVEGSHFSGRDFSYADERIWRNAEGVGGCGNASMWREWNTAHHITHVVQDLGRRDGRVFKKVDVTENSKQEEMFSDQPENL